MANAGTRKKWRLLRSYTSCSQALLPLHFLAQEKIRTHRRWRLAYLSIYCSRVFNSVRREFARKIHLQRSPSHSVIDMPSNFRFPFNLDPEKLKALVQEKNFISLQRLGGVEEVVQALESHAEAGVGGDHDDLRCRRKAFGTNVHQKVSADSLYQHLLKPFKDISLYVIIVCAIITLVHGINLDGWRSGWHLGGNVLLFPLVYSSVSFLIDSCVNKYFQKSCQVGNKFKLNTLINSASCIEVSRNWRRQPTLISEIVVGDIIYLKSGDIVPADGLFLEGESLKLDETSLSTTGKHDSDDDQVLKSNSNPFLFSNSKVIDGQARMLVTAVGMNTRWAEKTMMSCSVGSNSTPLQARIRKLGFLMLNIALVVASLVLLVMFARYFFGNYRDEDGEKEFLGTDITVLDILFAISRLVLASTFAFYIVDIDIIFQGIKIALAHSTKRMRTEKAIIHKLPACEMMGLVTAIIADEVGSLKLKEFKVSKLWVGGQSSGDGASLVVPDLFQQGIGLKTSGSPVRGPCQQIVAKAIAECQDAGVNIKLVTSENTSIASATATDCGLLKPNDDINGEHVIEGEEFRRYTPEEKMEKSDRICVMAASSPSDKVDMVQCLKQKGHMIAVLCDGTNATTTMEGANLSLSMGMQGNESTNQKADIAITDGNFASVVTVMRWGRCILNNTQKLIQFQLNSIIVTVINEIISMLTSTQSPYLDTRLGYMLVQIIWVNLILGMFAAWALGMELPEKGVLHKPVGQRPQPLLITNIMWRNIAAQAVYQIFVSQILQFWYLFGASDEGSDTMALVFSTFSQVFNLFNSRRLEKKNIFEGVLENRCFLGIVAAIVALQFVLVEVLQKTVSMERLDFREWLVCIGLAFASWPIGLVFKFVPVPDKPFQSYLHQCWLCLKSFLS